MGRMLGSFADEEELDRPDLNKCPDCFCFFGGLNCPICGKVCPEEMRAGNRKPVKKKKTRRPSSSGRVTFVSWYHSWWFIVLMMIFFPLVGIVLLITSPHEKWKKIVFVAIAVVYMAFSSIGIGNVINFAFGLLDRPVTTNLTKEEYIDRCQSVSAEELYRSRDKAGEFVTVKLKVVRKAWYAENGDSFIEDTYYVCEDVGGSTYNIMVRDCQLDEGKNLLIGDVITVYGEMSSAVVSYMDDNGAVFEGPCLNMAYVTVEKVN